MIKSFIEKYAKTIIIAIIIVGLILVAAFSTNQADTEKNQLNTTKPKPIMVSGSTFRNTIPSTATSIVFSDEVAPYGAILTDVSEAHDRSVVAWLDGTTYKISTETSGLKIYANQNSSDMFNGWENDACQQLTNIDVTNLDVSQVIDMSGMFEYAGYCTKTFVIEGLSDWHTSKVTDMSRMFASAGAGAETFNLDLSNWDTSKVTNMYCMFEYAGWFSSTWNIGDLNGWDTSQVTDMSGMFAYAGYSASRWTADLSGWDTSQVTSMSSMFEEAGWSASTFSIGDLSRWDTSQVTDMSCMFRAVGNSASAWNIGDLSNWNTSKVTNMYCMFNYAGYKASGWNIDCSSWNVNKVTDYSSFNGGIESKVTAPTWVN